MPKVFFFQMSLAEESRYLTTFITTKCYYRFKRAPFGLNDISESFQRMMEQILFGIEKVEISFDNVIVHTESMQELTSRLSPVFEKLRLCNLKLNRSKCEFGLI